MPSSHLILCHPLLLLPPIPPSIRVFSNEPTLRTRWPKYWSFSFSISPSNEHPGLISFRVYWLDLLAVQGTLKTCYWDLNNSLQSALTLVKICILHNQLPFLWSEGFLLTFQSYWRRYVKSHLCLPASHLFLTFKGGLHPLFKAPSWRSGTDSVLDTTLRSCNLPSPQAELFSALSGFLSITSIPGISERNHYHRESWAWLYGGVDAGLEFVMPFLFF